MSQAHYANPYFHLNQLPHYCHPCSLLFDKLITVNIRPDKETRHDMAKNIWYKGSFIKLYLPWPIIIRASPNPDGGRIEYTATNPMTPKTSNTMPIAVLFINCLLLALYGGDFISQQNIFCSIRSEACTF